MARAQLLPPGPKTIQIPCSAERSLRGKVFCKILESVDRQAPAGFGFAGRIVKPGVWIDTADLPDPLVVLECAGPAGQWKVGKQRDTVWILWAYDWKLERWMEIVRAQSLGWEWSLTIREPAWRLLNPEPGLYDVIARGNRLASEVKTFIDGKLEGEDEKLRMSILSAIYENICCRIAEGL